MPTNPTEPKFIYILHPYRGAGRVGERKANRDQIEAIALHLMAEGYVPISPIHCTGFLDDEHPIQREQAMELGAQLLARCDAVIAFILPEQYNESGRFDPEWFPWPSQGCKRDYHIAVDLQKPVWFRRYKPVPICETPKFRV